MEKEKVPKELIDMAKILLSVDKSIDVSKKGMQSKEGFYILKNKNLSIFKAFHSKGYPIVDAKAHLSENGISMIIHKDNDNYGISIWNNPDISNALCYSFWKDDIKKLTEYERLLLIED